jgi:hypothetical protein
MKFVLMMFKVITFYLWFPDEDLRTTVSDIDKIYGGCN